MEQFSQLCEGLTDNPPPAYDLLILVFRDARFARLVITVELQRSRLQRNSTGLSSGNCREYRLGH